jgi:hypothetical protein
MNRIERIQAIDNMLDEAFEAQKLESTLKDLGEAYDRWGVQHLEETTDDQLTEAEAIVRRCIRGQKPN